MDLPKLPNRPLDGHKGTFGTVIVIGGQASPPRIMIGGPALAALGALRVGAGLVTLAMPAPLLAAALTIVPSATGLALPVDVRGVILPSEAAAVLDAAMNTGRGRAPVVVIGCGLGEGEAQRLLTLRMLSVDGPSLVVDADAINALATCEDPQTALGGPAIITPHPGEWRRLAAAMRLDGDPIDPAQRLDAAQRMAGRLGAIVVLKGARTVVASALRQWTCEFENPALATGGTGDVLAGTIGGLLSQANAATPRSLDADLLFDMACLGVQLHAEAAAIWSEAHGNAGLLATDLATLIPDAADRRRTIEAAGRSQPA